MSKTTHNMRTFYTLIFTQVFSLIGSKISGLAIGIWIFNDTGNATPLTLVSFFAVLPMVLASSFSGVMADRWDRRYVMIVADAGQAVGTVLLLASFTSGGFELWHLYLITMVQSVFGVFQGPAFMASVTMLVPDDKRDTANSIQQLTQPASNIVAPVITGMLYAVIGVEGSIMIDLATFVVAMVVVFSVHIPRPEVTAAGQSERGSIWYESWTGLRWLRSNGTMFFIVIYISLINFMIGGVMVLSIPYILARTGSESTLGLLQGLTSFGAILGAIIIGAWGGTRPRTFTIFPAIMVAGLFLMTAGLAQNAVVLGFAMFFFMLPLPMVNTLFISIMQAKTPPDIQGRVFAVLGQMSMLLSPIAMLLAGPLADNVFETAVGTSDWDVFAPLVGNEAGAGMGLMFVVAGAMVFVVSLLVFSRRNVRNVETLMPDYVPTVQPETEEHTPDDIRDDLPGLEPATGATSA